MEKFIWVVMERRHGTDSVHLACINEKIAEREAERLDKERPSSDGFYVDTLNYVTE